MSRCFPYPPHVRAGRGEALIESIKLKSEKQAKTEQGKEKKREKERKEKRKYVKQGKLNDNGEKWEKLDGGLVTADTEQLDKSSITEEHGQPICCLNPCYLSDGSQSSNRRKREDSSSNGQQKSAKIVKIKFTLKKRQEPGDAITGGAQYSIFGNHQEPLDRKGAECSTSGRPDSVVESADQERRKLSNPSFSLEQGIQNAEFGGKDILSCLAGRFESEAQRDVVLYKALVEDWIPASLELEQDNDSEDEWLFGRKKQEKREASMSRLDNVSSPSSTPMWLSARYLPQAELYALPYTVPF